MLPWEDAWLNGKLMPPSGITKALLVQAQAIAEELLLDANLRCMLEEWVSRERAEDALGEVLWSGCRIRGQRIRRIRPVPVLVKLNYVARYPANIVELEEWLRANVLEAVDEWIDAYQQHGTDLEAAP